MVRRNVHVTRMFPALWTFPFKNLKIIGSFYYYWRVIPFFITKLSRTNLIKCILFVLLSDLRSWTPSFACSPPSGSSRWTGQNGVALRGLHKLFAIRCFKFGHRQSAREGVRGKFWSISLSRLRITFSRLRICDYDGSLWWGSVSMILDGYHLVAFVFMISMHRWWMMYDWPWLLLRIVFL